MIPPPRQSITLALLACGVPLVTTDDAKDLAFGFFSYRLDPSTTVSRMLSSSTGNNQFSKVPNEQPQLTLAGAAPANSAASDSGLNMRDYLVILTPNAQISPDLSYQLAVAGRSISQQVIASNAQDLICQGVAPTVLRDDHDVTVQGDPYWKKTTTSTWSTGFPLGSFPIDSNSSRLVFQVDANDNLTSTAPEEVNLNRHRTGIVTGLNIDDQTTITDDLNATIGVRLDAVDGMTRDSRLDSTIPLTYKATRDVTMHAGFTSSMQLPVFSGTAPDAPATFAGTSNHEGPGQSCPVTEHGLEWEFGIVSHPVKDGTISWNSYFEIAHRHLDAGPFGVDPLAELSGGVTSHLRPVVLSLDCISSRGQRGSFADCERLPTVYLVNAECA